MPGKSSEYAVIHPDQYDRPENAGEWTRRAIEPFVHHLVQNHPDLAQELASMGDPRTDPSTISWIDRGKNIQEFDTYRDYLLGPTDSELTVFGSYQESRELLNPVQQEHSAHTIADAMSHRPAETLNQHLPPNMDYANLHHQGRVPYASSYDSVMEAARNYYTEALTQTQSDIAEGLNLNLPVEYSSALRELRRLEHDIEQTALTGRPPTIHQSHHTASEYYEQMDIRANLLTGSFKAYMEFRFPEHMPGPEGDPYAVVFRQYTSSFPPADVEWMANSIASQRSEELDQKLGDTPGYNPLRSSTTISRKSRTTCSPDRPTETRVNAKAKTPPRVHAKLNKSHKNNRAAHHPQPAVTPGDTQMVRKLSMAKTFMNLSVQLTSDPYDTAKSTKVAELFQWAYKYTSSIRHLPQTDPGEYRNSVLHFPDSSAMTIMAAYPEDRIDLVPGTSTSNFQDPSRVTIKPEGPAAETYFSYIRQLQST